VGNVSAFVAGMMIGETEADAATIRRKQSFARDQSLWRESSSSPAGSKKFKGRGKTGAILRAFEKGGICKLVGGIRLRGGPPRGAGQLWGNGKGQHRLEGTVKRGSGPRNAGQRQKTSLAKTVAQEEEGFRRRRTFGVSPIGIRSAKRAIGSARGRRGEQDWSERDRRVRTK